MSLIEVAAAMTAGMMLMGVALTALIAIQRGDRRRSDEVDQRQAIAPLIDRLRDDLHQAEGFAWSEHDRALHLATAEEGEIVYKRTAGRWVRTDGDGSKSAYRLPRSLRWRVDPVEGSAGDLVRIQLYTKQKSASGDAEEAVLAELTAEAGRDRRLLIK